jgi:hypothetical protein
MVVAANPQRLHPTSMLDVYKVFKHLEMLWMGIWDTLMPLTQCAGRGGFFGKMGMAETV